LPFPSVSFSFSGFLSGAVQAIASAIRNVFIFLVQALQAVFVFLYNLLSAVFNFMMKVFQNIGKFFRHVWDNYLKNFFFKLAQLYAKLRAALAKIFGPLLRWLRKIREWLDKNYWPMVKRQLAMLHQLRQILSIFKAFNIKWAKALDERLAKTEQIIIHNTRVIYAKLNEVITLVNLAMDPLQLLILNAKTRGLLNAINDFILGVTGQTLNAWLGGPAFGLGGTGRALNLATLKQDMNDDANGEDNWLSAVRQRARGLYESLS